MICWRLVEGLELEVFSHNIFDLGLNFLLFSLEAVFGGVLIGLRDDLTEIVTSRNFGEDAFCKCKIALSHLDVIFAVILADFAILDCLVNEGIDLVLLSLSLSFLIDLQSALRLCEIGGLIAD